MKIGFIGTGIITEAIVTGLLTSDYLIDQVLVSKRGVEFSTSLAEKHVAVEVINDNQALVDQSDVVVLAVRPQVAEEVIRALTFTADKSVISLVATIPQETLLDWIGVTLPICRAIPLPFVADRIGATVVYPEHTIAKELFAAMGTSIVATTLQEFNSYVVASASMGMYFDMLNSLSAFLQKQGATEQKAQTYLAGLFLGLAHTAKRRSSESFVELKIGHCTKGGLNEQFAKVYEEQGGGNAIEAAMQSIQDRILKT